MDLLQTKQAIPDKPGNAYEIIYQAKDVASAGV